ncbi:MAG: hypothetical protein V9F01_10865 [Chitinophagaceae bacterium]
MLKPERVNEDYVVAVVTAVFEEGTQSVAVARPAVEPLLRNKKKAEMLKQKIGKVSTLEAAAAALGGKPIEVVDSIRINATSKLGYEPKVSGAVFNPANKGKVVPEALAGQSGVYVIRVDSVGTTPGYHRRYCRTAQKQCISKQNSWCQIRRTRPTRSTRLKRGGDH